MSAVQVYPFLSGLVVSFCFDGCGIRKVLTAYEMLCDCKIHHNKNLFQIADNKKFDFSLFSEFPSKLNFIDKKFAGVIII